MTKQQSVIYKITNPTGRYYIGKTINFNSRMSSYKNNNNPQQYIIYNSILKYGWENHVVEILEESTPDLISSKEIKYIKEYNSFHKDNPLGMNLTRGGEGTLGRKDSKETIDKRAQKLIGGTRSNETKKLMSDLKIGKKPVCATLPRSEKQKHHAKYGNIGKKHSKKSIEAKIETMKNKMLNTHGSILQLDIVTQHIVKEWFILPTEIAKIINVDYTHLLKSIKTENKKCHGYYWKYKI